MSNVYVLTSHLPDELEMDPLEWKRADSNDNICHTNFNPSSGE